MELAGADDKDGEPDSGELSGEIESKGRYSFFGGRRSLPVSAQIDDQPGASRATHKKKHREANRISVILFGDRAASAARITSNPIKFQNPQAYLPAFLFS